MRLGYFTMPVHPQHRNPTKTLNENREAIMLADRLGCHDAFVGEHLTDRIENITNSMMFLATLIHSTRTTKLGSGASNLSHLHPVLVAAQAAMFDHLAEGRFIFGIMMLQPPMGDREIDARPRNGGPWGNGLTGTAGARAADGGGGWGGDPLSSPVAPAS